MKRFYCTICQKAKRVRRLPNDYDDYDRVGTGTCRWHTSRTTHTAFVRAEQRQASAPPKPTYQKGPHFQPARPAASFKPSKSRRGKQAVWAAEATA